jgi:hypothetical protein
MPNARFWALYVSTYTLICGASLLFFPERAPFVHFSAGDKIWVQFAGMVFVAYSYFNVVLFRERLDDLLTVTFVCQAVFAVATAVTAFVLKSVGLGVVAAVLLIGTIGSSLSSMVKADSGRASPATPMPRTRFWNLYVAIYTGFFGVGPLVLPRTVVALFGFPYPDGLWVRFVGMAFLVLSYYNIVAYRNKGPQSAILSILIVRIWFIAVLSWLALSHNLAIIYPIIATVIIGVVGTVLTYRKETHAMS